MTLYDCAACDWSNPARAYGLAEMGAEWAAHIAEAHRVDVEDSAHEDPTGGESA